MGKVIKKCLACGTLNPYEAKTCKNCESPLLADVDQEDEILSIDPMEAALNDTVSEAEQEDDVVAQILREQAENAKRIVAKEKEKEERKKKKNPSESSRFSGSSGSSSFGFSIGGEGRSYGFQEKEADRKSEGSRGGGGSRGFKISDSSFQAAEEEAPGQVHISGGSLRMQAIRKAQESKEANAEGSLKK